MSTIFNVMIRDEYCFRLVANSERVAQLVGTHKLFKIEISLFQSEYDFFDSRNINIKMFYIQYS